MFFSGKRRVGFATLYGRKPDPKRPTSSWLASGIPPRYDVTVDAFSIYVDISSELPEVVEFAGELVICVAKVVHREELTVRHKVVKIVVGPVITKGRPDNSRWGTWGHLIRKTQKGLLQRRGRRRDAT